MIEEKTLLKLHTRQIFLDILENHKESRSGITSSKPSLFQPEKLRSAQVCARFLFYKDASKWKVEMTLLRKRKSR